MPKYSELIPAGTLDGTEVLAMLQGSDDVGSTVDDVTGFVSDALSGTYGPMPEGTPEVGQVAIVTDDSPLTLGWGDGGGAGTLSVLLNVGVPGAESGPFLLLPLTLGGVTSLPSVVGSAGDGFPHALGAMGTLVGRFRAPVFTGGSLVCDYVEMGASNADGSESLIAIATAPPALTSGLAADFVIDEIVSQEGSDLDLNAGHIRSTAGGVFFVYIYAAFAASDLTA